MITAVVLSGGVGARLWPASRESYPKPFLKLADGDTLIQKTYQRCLALEGIRTVLTITNKDYYFNSKTEYEKILAEAASISSHFILEPFGRNTAPPIILAALKIINEYGPEAILFVLPADHLITPQQAFSEACQKALALAAADKLVTFGIQPTAPETGYGYIQYGCPLNVADTYEVVQFTEKPSLDTAQQYLANGHYFWNSGMFCFKARVLLEQMQLHAPQLLESVTACWNSTKQKYPLDQTVIEVEAKSFDNVSDISIDYALMEKASNVAVVTGDFTWSDIGSWDAMSKLVDTDQNGNSVIGESILIDTLNTFISSEQRMVASIGLDNLIIIDTPDALLVAHRDRAQDVKNIVHQLKTNAHETYKTHKTVYRPWGSYTVLDEASHYKMKRIIVKPKASLSLQMHRHRSEHWVVIRGTAKVTNEDKQMLLNPNESTFIPVGHKHRLENPGVIDLEIIEVQTGEYLGEDDIIRFQDDYGRI